MTLNAEQCAEVWPIVRRELSDRAARGIGVRPQLRDAADGLRAVVAQMSERGHVSRTCADIGQQLNGDPRTEYSTDELAECLRVGPRHARRLAANAGIHPIGFNRWAASDVADLLRSRNLAA